MDPNSALRVHRLLRALPPKPDLAHICIVSCSDNADPTDPLHAGGSATAFALGSFRLVDETLYDTGGTDPEESNNLAYDVAHKAQRDRLLDLCLRDWSVRLKGPRDATRGQRLAYLKTTSTGRKARTPA